MPFTAHKDRRVFPPGLYDPPVEPHHIHRVVDDEGEPITCTDHRVENCPSEHWIGGHPQVDHPHHIEWDGTTGAWAYTRLSREEIADLAHLQAFELEQQEQQLAAAQERITILRAKAELDPAFKALAEHLGIPLES